jgi:hypothetical protein
LSNQTRQYLLQQMVAQVPLPKKTMKTLLV